MTVSVFDGCGEGCGYMAALCAVLAWGTFGVPLKFAKMQSTIAGQPPPEVNFFVMQSYKTCMCFFTCWLVLLMGEKFQFSPWGIVSGLFWVPGAACGIYGIRNAGLAIAVGTWSSVQVTTSFLFGIIVFHEEVHSMERAIMAFSTLILGLIGMARYSGMSQKVSAEVPLNADSLALTERFLGEEEEYSWMDQQQQQQQQPPVDQRSASLVRRGIFTGDHFGVDGTEEMPSSVEPMEMDSSQAFRENDAINSAPMFVEPDDREIITENYGTGGMESQDYFVLFGGLLVLSKRQVGILGAFINGAWGGCSLIPLHYAKRDHGLTGAGYLISYGVGSMIVNIIMWIMLYAYYYYFVTEKNWKAAVQALPKWHLRQLWWPGFLAGLLYSIGNFGSIMAVTYLGQAQGYSMCQLQLFVSGLWGVFYFREMKQEAIIIRWFISAAVAIVGIIWLSSEHEGAGGGHRL